MRGYLAAWPQGLVPDRWLHHKHSEGPGSPLCSAVYGPCRTPGKDNRCAKGAKQTILDLLFHLYTHTDYDEKCSPKNIYFRVSSLLTLHTPKWAHSLHWALATLSFSRVCHWGIFLLLPPFSFSRFFL